MQNAGRCLSLSFDDAGAVVFRVENRPIPHLQTGEVLVKLLFSSVGHKDRLIFGGSGGFRPTPNRVLGNDAVGIVIESRGTRLNAGDRVLVIAKDFGTGQVGGLSEFLMAPEAHLMSLPSNWDLESSISLGVPGFTAALGISLLASGEGNISESLCVTGASGAVGGFAIEFAASLASLEITAVTAAGGPGDNLVSLGAHKVMPYKSLLGGQHMKLLPERWDQALDTLGGVGLNTILKSLRPRGKVVSVGNVTGNQALVDLAPFFLRAVTLMGANLEQDWQKKRESLCGFITDNWPTQMLGQYTSWWTVGDVPKLLQSKMVFSRTPRTVISLNSLHEDFDVI